MVTVVDCTFRDGGYKTRWNFDHGRVKRHIIGTTADVVEIGYRSTPQNTECGIYRYCPDNLVAQLAIPKPVALMVNAAEWTDELFVDAAVSNVRVVRVAAHIEIIDDAVAMVEKLRARGYYATLNIMQAHRAPLSVWSTRYPADVVYFADSFGCMSPPRVARIANTLASHNKNVGFHAHNNMRRAFANVRAAYRNGATWIDGTVDGIGRGAGNADIETILRALGRQPPTNAYRIQSARSVKSAVVFYLGALLRRHPSRVEAWV